jgi:hypothetical protein
LTNASVKRDNLVAGIFFKMFLYVSNLVPIDKVSLSF